MMNDQEDLYDDNKPDISNQLINDILIFMYLWIIFYSLSTGIVMYYIKSSVILSDLVDLAYLFSLSMVCYATLLLQRMYPLHRLQRYYIIKSDYKTKYYHKRGYFSILLFILIVITTLYMERTIYILYLLETTKIISKGGYYAVKTWVTLNPIAPQFWMAYFYNIIVKGGYHLITHIWI
ncbi:MAG: hypothetical protein Solumvirus1_57 [Solumvirus sp.]|uniref:Uncharacterized protein n=1 Tax=Solumvirus sp. TaxID=2487773 RepID=A0A3G5AG91_9VIRU|nr:MAG: hypothetical protein Solumvirus1_57 [Solumvirus sp.]